MSGNKKHTAICQNFLHSNKCPNGEKCILKHIDVVSPQADKGRTFAILPFSDLRPQSTFKPPITTNNSKLPSTTSYSKSPNPNKLKTTSNTTTVKNNYVNNLQEFPSLSKAQKKRNRRKGKTINEPKEENIIDRMNEKNLCLKSKSECSNKNCRKLHGDICDLCKAPVLHPLNAQFRREHSQQCVKQHEDKMKEVLATHRSVDKQCGICFELVMQKKGDRRFAVLPDCNHCFCLVCIKIWRKSAGFGKAIRKSCPECRVVSHYVCPNTYWVENKEEKLEVIQKYKDSVGKLDCKYFAKNQKCPFGNKCFYKHCDKDGTLVDLGSPRRNRNRAFNIRRQDALMMDALYDIIMNDSDNMSDDFDQDYDDYEFQLGDSDDDYDGDSDYNVYP